MVMVIQSDIENGEHASAPVVTQIPDLLLEGDIPGFLVFPGVLSLSARRYFALSDSLGLV
jgi:hypothetical protein